MPHRKPELERIIKDLKAFVGESCNNSCSDQSEGAGDFVSETCNDACLMLEQAREALEKKEKGAA